MNLVEDAAQNDPGHRRRKPRDSNTAAMKNLPPDWQRMQGPLMSVPTDMVSPAAPLRPQRQRPGPRSNVKASLLCCVRDVGNDQLPPSRHRQYQEGNLGPNNVFEMGQSNTMLVARPMRAQLLLTELAKPISPADAEGYIYMFWLTPESDTSKPDDDAASDLLELPISRPGQERRPSDVLQRYASQRRGPMKAKTMLLKIAEQRTFIDD